MYGWFDLIRNDKLDGGGLERILRIEPDHEVKHLVLHIEGVISDERNERSSDRAVDERV